MLEPRCYEISLRVCIHIVKVTGPGYTNIENFAEALVFEKKICAACSETHNISSYGVCSGQEIR